MKKETLEEAAERFYPPKTTDLICSPKLVRDAFIAGAEWQSERMYSAEEVIKIVEKSRETGLTAEFLLLTEQFKKK